MSSSQATPHEWADILVARPFILSRDSRPANQRAAFAARAHTKRLAARADRAARADLPQLTRQQKCVHISTQSESADTAARTAFRRMPLAAYASIASPARWTVCIAMDTIAAS